MKTISVFLASLLITTSSSFADRGGSHYIYDYLRNIIEQVNENSQEIIELEDDMELLSERVGQLESNGGGTGGGTTDPALANQVNTNTTDIAALQSAVQANSAAIANVESQLTALANSINANGAASQANSDAIAGLIIELGSLRSELLTLTNQVNSQSGLISANTANIAINANRIDVLEANLGGTGTGGAPTYDYHLYSNTTAVQKIYATRGLGTCPEETREFSRVATADGIQVTILRNRVDTINRTVCQERTFTQLETTDALFLLSSEALTNGVVTQNKVLDAPGVVMTSTMQVGLTYGEGTTVTTTDNTGLITESGFVETNTLLAVEDVTVPYGTFTGCLKIHTERRSGNIGNFSRTSWRCPDIGEVKRISVNMTSSAVSVWELIDMIPFAGGGV